MLVETNPHDIDEWLTFSLNDIEESWRQHWGQTLTSDTLRRSILAAPRFSSRIRNEIFEYSERFIKSQSFNDINTSQFEIDDEKKFVPLYLRKSGARLFRDAGLAWYSHIIKDALNSQSGNELISRYGKNTLRQALSFVDVAPDLSQHEDHNISLVDTEILEQQGIACFFTWIFFLPETWRSKLVVFLPKDLLPQNIIQPSLHTNVHAIVHRVLS